MHSIYADWERGDFSHAEWAHPDIEYVIADGPAPGSWIGVAAMSSAHREWLNAWADFRSEVDEYRELDNGRALALTHRSGRGRTSGVEVGTEGSRPLPNPQRQGDKTGPLYRPRPRPRRPRSDGVGDVPGERGDRAASIYGSGPLTDAADALAPSAEFDFTDVYPDQPVLRGVEEMRRFRDAARRADLIHFAPERYFDVDDERVLVFVHVTSTGQASGAAVETHVAQEFTIRDGLIVRVKIHRDRAEALKAVGLEE